MSSSRRGMCGAWLVAAATVLCVAVVPRAALADDPPAADAASVTLSERRAAEAYQAYARKDYPAAVALYLEAYQAAPSGTILYNVARIYDTKLADRPLAINFYRRYITDPGARPEFIEVANQRLRELREAEITASTLDVESAPPGAAGAAGKDRRDRGDRGSTATGDRDRAGVNWDRSAPPPKADASDGERAHWSGLRWTGAVLGAVGVVGLGIGAGFGWAAMSKAKTADDLCDGNACSSQQGVDATNAARHDATLSTIGFAAGGALLATGVALFILGGDQGTERGAESRGSPHAGLDLQLRSWASATDLSVAVAGRW